MLLTLKDGTKLETNQIVSVSPALFASDVPGSKVRYLDGSAVDVKGTSSEELLMRIAEAKRSERHKE